MSPPPPSAHPDETPLAGVDVDALIPTFVATRADIAVAEQANIEAATRWAFGGRRVTEPLQLLTVEFSDRLHRRMFGDVWRWAGQRSTERTATGVLPEHIEPRLESLFDDARWWHDHDMHAPSERAVKICQGLIKVHAYRDGNGRHARFLADLYLHLIGVPRLDWNSTHDVDTAEAGRRADLTALQQALDRASRNLRPTRLGAALDRALAPPPNPADRLDGPPPPDHPPPI